MTVTYLTGNSASDQAAQYLNTTNYSHGSLAINLQLNASQTVSGGVTAGTVFSIIIISWSFVTPFGCR